MAGRSESVSQGSGVAGGGLSAHTARLRCRLVADAAVAGREDAWRSVCYGGAPARWRRRVRPQT